MLDILQSSRSLPLVGRRGRNIFIRPYRTRMRLVWACMVERIVLFRLIWSSIMEMMPLRTVASMRYDSTGGMAGGCRVETRGAAGKSVDLSWISEMSPMTFAVMMDMFCGYDKV